MSAVTVTNVAVPALKGVQAGLFDIGHNLPQEAPRAFADENIEVDGF